MNNKMGLKLNKFVVANNNEIRDIRLKNGLNIIFGPTDTGKTYIYQCIKYLLGSNKLPKSIPENTDFNDAYLEIESLYNNSTFTLKRTFSTNKIRIYDCAFNEIKEGSTSISVNTKGSKNLISTKLLEYSGIDQNINIKTHIREDKYKKIALRDLLHFSFVTEIDIITDESLLTTGQYNSKTFELNLYYFLISGHTSYLTYLSDKKSRKKKKQPKSNLDNQNTFITNLINETNQELLALEETEFDEEVSYTEELLFVTSEIEKQSHDLKDSFKIIEKLKSSRMMNQELLKRFGLLTEQFNSDLKRLEFIAEGGDIISKLTIENCPTCGKKLGVGDHENHLSSASVQDINAEVLFSSYNAERKKILLNLNDLKLTVKNLENENQIIGNEIIKNEKKYQFIKEKIDLELKPTRTSLEKKINKVIDQKVIEEKIEYLKKKLDGFQSQILNFNYIEDITNTNQNTTQHLGSSFDNQINRLCNIMNSYLLDMEFPGTEKEKQNVKFNQETNDFIVNDKSRSVYGKGYRAIIYSVFLVSFMKFCKDSNLPNIGFVVIDSPLTTYQENENEFLDEKIPEDLKKRFINTLSSERSLQIIIFENKFSIPASNINAIEFTRDINRGRYGFM